MLLIYSSYGGGLGDVIISVVLKAVPSQTLTLDARHSFTIVTLSSLLFSIISSLQSLELLLLFHVSDHIFYFIRVAENYAKE